MTRAREEVVITSGREKKPVAKLVPVERKGGIQFGLMKDIMPPITSDLFEPLPEEELRAWEESEI
jgi:antitoxin (DNA-binding transcriptional repressor) of toxin-antitoxin stability system